MADFRKGHQWERDEVLLVLEAYLRLRFGTKGPREKESELLGPLIGASPGAIFARFKCFQHFDPAMRERGVFGLAKGTKLDRAVWDWYVANPQALEAEVRKARRRLKARG